MAAEKEIDLLDITSFILNYISTKLVRIIVILALCIAIPCIYYSVMEKCYVSQMTFTTNTTDYTLVKEIADPLTRSIQYSQTNVSQRLLNVPAETTELLKEMTVLEVPPHPAERKEGCMFTVEITTPDRALFDQLATPLHNYFNQNAFIQEITAVKLEMLTELEQNTKQQIARLDSIQKLIPEAITSYEKNKSLFQDFNLGTLYHEMFLLKEAETEATENIKLIEEFKIVSGFNLVFPKRGIVFYIGIGLAIGLAINCLLFIQFTYAYLINRKKENE
jgi:hypothetical protein